MSSFVIPAGILVAAISMTGAVASGFIKLRPSRRVIRRGRHAFVECPRTQRLTRIRVLFDRERKRFLLAECEHLTKGEVAGCGWECLPSLN